MKLRELPLRRVILANLQKQELVKKLCFPKKDFLNCFKLLHLVGEYNKILESYIYIIINYN